METITCANDLTTAILVLEKKQEDDRREMKEAFEQTVEKFKPANLLKNAVSEIIALPKDNPEIMRVAVGLTAGYIVKKLLVSSSLNPFKLLLGNILEIAVAGYIARNPEKFRSLVINIAKFIMKFKRRREQKLMTIAIQAG